MMLYGVRDIVTRTINYMANLYRIRNIYFTTLLLYFFSRLYVEDDISNYDWFITFPGMLIGGFMLKHINEHVGDISSAELIILYICAYLVIFILISGTIIIMIENTLGVDIMYL